MRFLASEIASAVQGTVVGPDVAVDGATIDSRRAKPGQLFVPIVAERDGHAFVEAAVEAGATAYLTATGPMVPKKRATAIEVDDTGMAFLDLGRLARAKFDARTHVIGITGSVGKTTVKDLLAAVLGPPPGVTASRGNLNNELGVPLTLVNAPQKTKVVVSEMGARGRGHVALLCDVASPTIGVITEVTRAHTELFGTLTDVAVAKGELVEALPAHGVAILNGDNPLVAAMARRTGATTYTFGLDATNDIRASKISLDHELRASFAFESPWGAAEVRLAVCGEHQVGNALAAAGAALAYGCLIDQVVEGLAEAMASPWRMEFHRTPTGLQLINDAYNASPAAMEAALRALAAIPAERRIAVLGVMAELGEGADIEHRRIGKLAADLGVMVIAVDAPGYKGRAVKGIEGALDELDRLAPFGDGDALLVKGSRIAGLEQVAEVLLDEA